MPSRRRSRERALQILYQWDMRKQPVGDAIDSFYSSLSSEEESNENTPPDQFMEALVQGTVERAEEIDQRIAAHSAHWRLERMPAVDRNILRLAVFEMLAKELAPAIIIDEALELARRFSGDESVAFVNGVLDAVHKELGT